MGSDTVTSVLLGNAGTAELYKRATQSEFLRLAGLGRLPRDQLSLWLSQDRLYCQAYARFIGGLISRVDLPLQAEGNDTTSALAWRILTLLRDSLDGMMTELKFFEQTAGSYGLDLTASRGGGGGAVAFGADTATQQYIDWFDSFSAKPAGKGDSSKTLVEGLVLLWSTEKVYLDAWTYAKEQRSGVDEAWAAANDLDGGALLTKFVPNWTSPGFQAFVTEIGECLDLYAAQVQSEVPPGEVTTMALREFTRCLKLEEEFWPTIAQ